METTSTDSTSVTQTPKTFTYRAIDATQETTIQGPKYGQILRLPPGTLIDSEGNTMHAQQSEIIIVGPGATYNM